MKKIAVVGTDKWSCQVLVDELKKMTGFGLLIKMERVVADFNNQKVWFEDIDLTTLDAIIIKKISNTYDPCNIDQLEILRYLESCGVRIFSKPEAVIRLLDRLSCTTTLQQGQIPMPPTVITQCPERAQQAVKKFGKAILKPLWTSKARGMEVLTAEDPQLLAKLEKYQQQYGSVLYLQQMLNITSQDYGVVFLGGQYLATYARVKQDQNSWNTTTKSGGKYEPYEPSQEIIDLAYKAQGLFDLDFTCVDMVEVEGQVYVFEVSAFGGFKGLLEANNINAAELYSQFVLAQLNVPPTLMSMEHELLKRYVLPGQLMIKQADTIIQVNCSNLRLQEKLGDYYKSFIHHGGDLPDIVVNAYDGQYPSWSLDFIPHQRPAGKDPKESICDLVDGRVVYKNKTGLVMAFGNQRNFVCGDCLTNDNQVINFINNRFIENRLRSGALLFHSAALTSGSKGIALSGVAGAGKSTLALYLMTKGCTFVSNDRLLVQEDNGQVTMAGVAKHPRINPGTILARPELSHLLSEGKKNFYQSLPQEELWDYEDKYDALIEDCYGEDKFCLSGPLNALAILNWSHCNEPLKITKISVAERPDLISTYKKLPGVFYWPEDAKQAELNSDSRYYSVLDKIEVFEVTGGVDFNAAADWFKDYLEK